MEFVINKQVSEKVNIETPAYFKDLNTLFFYRITERGIMAVSKKIVYITTVEDWQKQISSIIKYEQSNEDEFEAAYGMAIVNLSGFKLHQK